MQAVVFDVGNVLIGWNPYLVFRDLFKDDDRITAFLEEIEFHEWNLSLDRGRDWEEAVQSLSASYPRWEKQIRYFNDKWHLSISGEITDNVKVLNKLRESEVPVYAITNFAVQRWQETTTTYPFLKTHFVDSVVSGEVKMIKPDPDIFELFLNRNDLEAAACIFIDDRADNVETASSLGFDCVLFQPETDLAGELRARGLPV
ncbi:MAG: HAD family phosphatase [Pseudomonadota bacterium]